RCMVILLFFLVSTRAIEDLERSVTTRALRRCVVLGGCGIVGAEHEPHEALDPTARRGSREARRRAGSADGDLDAAPRADRDPGRAPWSAGRRRSSSSARLLTPRLQSRNETPAWRQVRLRSAVAG